MSVPKGVHASVLANGSVCIVIDPKHRVGEQTKKGAEYVVKTSFTDRSFEIGGIVVSLAAWTAAPVTAPKAAKAAGVPAMTFTPEEVAQMKAEALAQAKAEYVAQAKAAMAQANAPAMVKVAKGR